MKRIRFLCTVILVFCLTAASVNSQQPKSTTVRVIASEYYDDYQLPDCKTWQQVESVLIEGQSSVGSIQVTRTGPCDELEAALPNVVIPSEYWVTIIWQGGEQFRQSYTSVPRQEIVHRVARPF